MGGRLTSQKLKHGALAAAVWLAVPALFALTAYSIWMDRAASAAVAGAFTIGFVILWQLPLVESFKIFTLEAKFAKRVDEAEKLLDSIRETAEVHSRLLYWQVAVGDRLASMGWSRKREIIKEFDNLLSGLGLTGDQVAELKKPFLHIIALDLFRVYENAVAARVRLAQSEIQNRIGAYPKPIEAGDQRYAEMIEQSRALTLPFRTTEDVMEDGRLDDMGAITEALIQGTPLPKSEKDKLEIIREEVVTLATACRGAGTITPEAEAYLDKYSRRTDTRVDELYAAPSPDG